MRKTTVLFLLICLLNILAATDIFAEDGSSDTVGVDERPGSFVPVDLVVHDEKGKEVVLKELMDRPSVLILTYFTCSHICPQMLGSLAVALGKLPLEPVKDYRVITLSFDDADTPRDAQSQKINYLKAIDKPFPEDGWKFLTADKSAIEKISRAVGIGVKKTEHGFVHPEVLIFLSPGGKITKYLHVSKYSYGLAYPITFSTLELVTAFSEARQGKVCEAGKKEPLYCFLHEPGRQKLFFTILKVSGAATLLVMFALFVVLRARRGISQERSNGCGK